MYFPFVQCCVTKCFDYNLGEKYHIDQSIIPPSSKVPTPKFQQLSELDMHASISPPQNYACKYKPTPQIWMPTSQKAVYLSI